MPEFTNLNDLFDYIKRDVMGVALVETGERVRELLKEYVQQKIYSYEPKEYQRANEFENFLDSISILSNDFVTITIGYDTSKIIARDSPNGSIWNQHENMDKEDMSEYIPLWLEEGTDYPSYYPRHGIWAIETVYGDLLNYREHLKMYAHVLQEYGYDVIIRT